MELYKRRMRRVDAYNRCAFLGAERSWLLGFGVEHGLRLVFRQATRSSQVVVSPSHAQLMCSMHCCTAGLAFFGIDRSA